MFEHKLKGWDVQTNGDNVQVVISFTIKLLNSNNHYPNLQQQ
jgi:hypothetical protein